MRDSEIIVADNGSTDGTREWLKRTYPQVNLISLGCNRGFTGAANAAARAAKGTYLLILNNDCKIDVESLKQLVHTLEGDSKLVATQPVVYTSNGSIEQIGYFVELRKGKASIVQSPERIPVEARYQQWQENTHYFYGLSATCLLVRAAAFREIGMFDESFHSYLEDVDLSIRFAKANMCYAPSLNARCIHLHRGTSSNMGSFKERRDLCNWIKIIIKHYSPTQLRRYWAYLVVERLRNVSGLVKKVVQ